MKKRILALFLATCMLCACMAGCSGSPGSSSGNVSTATSGGSTATSSDKVKIGLIVMDLSNEYFVHLSEGTQAYADDNGYELTIIDGAGDPVKQVEGMENLIAAGCVCIDARCLDGDAMHDVVQEAVNAGIMVNTYPDIENVTTINTNDEYGQGYVSMQLCCEWLAAKFPGEACQIAILEQSENRSVMLRVDGMKQALKDSGMDNVVVVAEQSALSTTEGMSVAESLLQANPDLKGIVTCADTTAMGVYEAATAAGKTGDDFFVSGIDGDSAAIDLVKNGNGIYKVCVAGELMIQETSYQVMQNLMCAYKGEKYDKECANPVYPVTADTVDEYLARAAAGPDYAYVKTLKPA